MSPDLEFLKQPLEIQVALAIGYAAYVLAYTGLRDRQRTIDVAFLSLVFSVPATMIFGLLAGWSPTISIPLAFVATSVVGCSCLAQIHSTLDVSDFEKIQYHVVR
jgi:4-hydroxybenzoate polyprenyltransferase